MPYLLKKSRFGINFFAKINTILLLYVYQVFIFLQDHLHFFLHFFFTFMEQLFLDDPISFIWLLQFGSLFFERERYGSDSQTAKTICRKSDGWMNMRHRERETRKIFLTVNSFAAPVAMQISSRAVSKIQNIFHCVKTECDHRRRFRRYFRVKSAR